MKKLFLILGLAALAVAGFAMFKITKYDNGKENAQNDPETSGIPTEETRQKGSEETGTGIDS